ncbi:MAG: hypothetical protein RMZ42_10060 [Nostoc sp. DedQUE05]|uniref:hypothetical protein n=1 Tax=Nostoc sp. DedQUE05 TaxID=3075391 RepID=UPI002AD3DB25|nr:hypothetical protein [Nostoc sp. DedQUE05]MDZ8092274.1 hypothetical protein [Nostoc sp. DedQUE05]
MLTFSDLLNILVRSPILSVGLSAIARYHRIGFQKFYTFDKLCCECDRSNLDIINSKIFI